MSEPDLTAELDAAEAIVMGRVESVVTEWGVRYAPGRVGIHGVGPDNEHRARFDAASEPGALVRRTVTYGPWEPANPSAPSAGTGESP